nr:epoxyqueuosine reductase QueH [Chitinophaga sp. MD30]
MASGIDFTLFFYNPNIHPKKEYEIRKDENTRSSEKHNIPFVDKYCGCTYSLRDTNKWRIENGREKIKLGEKYYGRDSED